MGPQSIRTYLFCFLRALCAWFNCFCHKAQKSNISEKIGPVSRFPACHHGHMYSPIRDKQRIFRRLFGSNLCCCSLTSFDQHHIFCCIENPPSKPYPLIHEQGQKQNCGHWICKCNSKKEERRPMGGALCIHSKISSSSGKALICFHGCLTSPRP